MQQIEKEGRGASPDEQAQLIKFCAFSSTDLAESVFRRAGVFREGWDEIGETLEGAGVTRGAGRAGTRDPVICPFHA